MYIGDYNDWLPAQPASDLCSWNLDVSGKPYLPRLLNTYIPGDLTNVADWPAKDGMPAVWTCPSSQPTPRLTGLHPYWYAANPWLSSTPGTYKNPTNWIGNDGCNAAEKTSVIRKSFSELVVLEDILPHNVVSFNVLFLDGHVGVLRAPLEWWMAEHHGPNVK